MVVLRGAARRLRCMEAHLSGATESMMTLERGLDERSLARADEALLSLAYVVADKPSTAEEAAASSSGKLLGQEMGALESLGERLRVYKTGAKMVTSVIKMGLDLHSALRRNPYTLADTWEDVSKQFVQNVALLFEDQSYTYGELNHAANRVANWGREDAQLKAGDVVALFMQNRPEFFITWLGMAKLGVTTALINTNLNGKPLEHVLKVSQARTLIIGPEQLDHFETTRQTLKTVDEGEWSVWVFQGREATAPNPLAWQWAKDMDVRLSAHDEYNTPSSLRAGVKMVDPLFLIYTSGTTGLPKPCKVSHKKVWGYMQLWYRFANLTSRDRIYVTLPAYHSNGGTLSLSAWMAGGAIVLRRKFSASAFWDDARKYRATGFIYIGELCRYLYAQPPSPKDNQHPIRFMIGNGLRGDIWDGFRKRFGIETILEFYGATEGNIGLLNYNGRAGACGQLPYFLRPAVPFRLIKYDVENDAHIRTADGFCIECPVGEVGEGIGRIDNDPNKMTGNFDGYTDPQATKKKILTDVFEKGDQWFRTGDLLAKDFLGYFYFVDRIGDTFRWKGENVATSEVEMVINSLPNIVEVTVYGVPIPGKDGRAGMAAIAPTPGTTLDVEQYLKVVTEQLPAYARPVFVRVMGEIDTTSTFKHNKAHLVKQGFDPEAITDAIYLVTYPGKHTASGSFTRLDRQLADAIAQGKHDI